MEIKAVLIKPYSEEDRINFIIDKNYNKNYNIVETDTQLEAWGYTKEEEEEQERKRISQLTCTKRVLVLMLEELGYDYFEQIQPLIELNRKAKLEWELCSELLRSNPLLDIIGEQLLLSHEQIDRLFKYANGEVDTLKEVHNG